MSKTIPGVKVAILVANGFNEAEMIAAQKALMQAGANARIVSPEPGLVNGWNGMEWGHHFAVDAPLSSALGADYAMLVIPGGTRSMDKLKITAHTKRFIGSFMAACKPVAAYNDALQILMFTGNLDSRTVSGPEQMKDMAAQAGLKWVDSSTPCIDGNLMTGICAQSEEKTRFAAAMIDFFAEARQKPAIQQEAA
ncbi:MAG: DJ-1/PfpI family protein [Proteobacteria bacterium]|nr:DJ-1/PfpI family protein [Pseudomonadota bacterium]